jgi:hypothetical protein
MKSLFLLLVSPGLLFAATDPICKGTEVAANFQGKYMMAVYSGKAVPKDAVTFEFTKNEMKVVESGKTHTLTAWSCTRDNVDILVAENTSSGKSEYGSALIVSSGKYLFTKMLEESDFPMTAETLSAFTKDWGAVLEKL